MKLFVAHKVSGEDYESLHEEMETICSSFKESGNDSYCSFLDDKMRKEKSKKELIMNAFKKIDALDGVLAIVKSSDKSEGLLIEIGYALGKKKKIVLAINEKVKDSYLRQLSDKVIEFSTIQDLNNRLKEFR